MRNNDEKTIITFLIPSKTRTIDDVVGRISLMPLKTIKKKKNRIETKKKKKKGDNLSNYGSKISLNHKKKRSDTFPDV